MLELRDGRVLATGLAVPGILAGVVGGTADGHPAWYRLTADNETVLVDPGSLRQTGPATAKVAGDVIGAADGRLLVGPSGRFTSPVQVLI